jgi:drug/metabolite transporter (DMT)-like permease
VTPSRARIALALGTVYLVWGSTYLAIRWTVAELPPLLAGSLRFTAAGLGFLLIARALGPIAVSPRRLASAALVGAIMPGASNGLVNLAEQTVPSGLTALILAVMPLWLALFQALRRGQPRPGRRAVVGLVVGFAGTALLVGRADGGSISVMGVLMLMAAAMLWAFGSLYAREVDRPRPWMASAGFEMLAGGLVQAVFGLAHGELPRLVAAHPSPRAVASLIYLAAVGAWAGYGAFSWLTNHARPTLVSTYCYVNPLVAVLLGWSLAGEPLAPRTLAAAALIVCSVFLVTTARATPPRPAPPPTPEPHAGDRGDSPHSRRR